MAKQINNRRHQMKNMRFYGLYRLSYLLHFITHLRAIQGHFEGIKWKTIEIKIIRILFIIAQMHIWYDTYEIDMTHHKNHFRNVVTFKP